MLFSIFFLSLPLLFDFTRAFPLRIDDPSDIWAVLVAGSNGYINYRHQADVSASYQLLIERGVPRDQILVLMYDDAANHTNNPYPGKLFNWPNGPNVYEGVRVDYRKEQVNWQNFKKMNPKDIEALMLKETIEQLNKHKSCGDPKFVTDSATIKEIVD